MKCCHFKANFYTSPGFEPTFGGTERMTPGLGTIAAIGEHYKEIKWFDVVVTQAANGKWSVTEHPDYEDLAAVCTGDYLVLLRTQCIWNTNGESFIILRYNGTQDTLFTGYEFSANTGNNVYELYCYSTNIPPLDPTPIIDPSVPITPIPVTPNGLRNLRSSIEDWEFIIKKLDVPELYTINGGIIYDDYGDIANSKSFDKTDANVQAACNGMYYTNVGFVRLDQQTEIILPLKRIERDYYTRNTFYFETIYQGFIYYLSIYFNNGMNDPTTTWTYLRQALPITDTYYCYVTENEQEEMEIVAGPTVYSIYQDIINDKPVHLYLVDDDEHGYLLPLVEHFQTTSSVQNQLWTQGNVRFQLLYNGVLMTLAGYTVFKNGSIHDDMWTLTYEEASFGTNVNYGDGLIYDSNTNTLSVDIASEVASDNTKPISSAAVYTTVGNINALLETI